MATNRSCLVSHCWRKSRSELRVRDSGLNTRKKGRIHDVPVQADAQLSHSSQKWDSLVGHFIIVANELNPLCPAVPHNIEKIYLFRFLTLRLLRSNESQRRKAREGDDAKIAIGEVFKHRSVVKRAFAIVCHLLQDWSSFLPAYTVGWEQKCLLDQQGQGGIIQWS